MDGGAQGRFGRASLPDPLQDAAQVVHAIGVANVLRGGKRFVVGQPSLRGGEAYEIPFEPIERDRMAGPENFTQAPSKSGTAPRFHQLRDALVQPLRAPSAAYVINKGVRQFVV